jgi:hypothetical protein
MQRINWLLLKSYRPKTKDQIQFSSVPLQRINGLLLKSCRPKTKDQIQFSSNAKKQIDFFSKAADQRPRIRSAAFGKKSICSLHLKRIKFGPWSLVCCIWEEVNLFMAKELNWIWSLVFALLYLERSRFVHGQGTELNLVLGLWSAAFVKKAICSWYRN